MLNDYVCCRKCKLIHGNRKRIMVLWLGGERYREEESKLGRVMNGFIILILVIISHIGKNVSR